MLRSIQFLGSSSGFLFHRLKLHGNHSGLSFISISAKSSPRRPLLTTSRTPRCFRQFRASPIRSGSNPDVTSPSSSSSPSPIFRSTGSDRKINFCQSCGGPTKYEIPDGDEKERATCTLCGRISYENPKMVVGCLIEHDNKILLCKRNIQPSYGLWTLPAGYMENGESASEGAMRETWEEARAKVEVISPFAQLDIPLIGQTYIIFLAKLLTPHFSPGPESSECRLFAYDDIPYESLSFSSMLVTLNLVCVCVVVLCVLLSLTELSWFQSYRLCSISKILRLENQSFTTGSSTRALARVLRKFMRILSIIIYGLDERHKGIETVNIFIFSFFC